MPFIHFNLRLSALKGAKGGFNFIKDLAAATGVEVFYGDGSGYDNFMTMPDDPAEAEILEHLLVDNNMHFEKIEQLPIQHRWRL